MLRHGWQRCTQLLRAWQVMEPPVVVYAGNRRHFGSKPPPAGVHKFDKVAIEPRLAASYEDVITAQDNPATLLVDVREPEELAATGRIPSSINIPLKSIENELRLTADAFKAKYGCEKPAPADAIIFYCRIGVRSGNAANVADKLGYHNVKNYVGSWLEYAEKQGLPK